MICDLHSDLLLDVYDRRVRGERGVVARRHLPVLTGAGVAVQVLAVYCPTTIAGDGALRHALRLIDAAWRDADESDGAFRIVTNRAELDEAVRDGALAGILALEGAEPIGRDVQLIDTFWRLGVRSVGLTWNRANDVADGCGEDRGVGITPLGWTLLERAAQLGVVLDVSHLTARAAHHALDRYTGRVMASHSNAAAVWPHRRNLEDDLLRGVADRDGVIGLAFVPAFVGRDPIRDLARHHDHIRSVAGPDRVAIGADFMAFLDEGPAEPPWLSGSAARPAGEPAPREPDRETAYRDLAALISEPERALGENAMRFLRGVL